MQQNKTIELPLGSPHDSDFFGGVAAQMKFLPQVATMQNLGSAPMNF